MGSKRESAKNTNENKQLQRILGKEKASRVATTGLVRLPLLNSGVRAVGSFQKVKRRVPVQHRKSPVLDSLGKVSAAGTRNRGFDPHQPLPFDERGVLENASRLGGREFRLTQCGFRAAILHRPKSCNWVYPASIPRPRHRPSKRAEADGPVRRGY